MSSRTASGWWRAACTASPWPWPTSRQHHGATLALRRRGDRDRDDPRARQRRAARHGRASSPPTPSSSMPTWRRSRAAASEPRQRRAVAAAPRSARSLSAVTWSLRRRDGGLSAAHGTPCSSPTTMPPSSTTSSGARACRHRPPSTSARRTGRPGRRLTRRAGTPAVPRQRAAHRRHPPFRTSGDRAMRGADFRRLERCGLHVQRRPEATVATTPADFERLYPGDGRRALRPGVARLDGVLQPTGRHAPGFRACIWRAAARIRVRACRWRRCRAGSRRRAVLADLASTRRSRPAATRWWYVDALSDDGRHGLTLIAFIGSVFSPYYAWARRRARRPGRPGAPLRAQRRAVWRGREALGDDRAGPRESATVRACAGDRAERALMGRPSAHRPHRRDHRPAALAHPRARCVSTRPP